MKTIPVLLGVLLLNGIAPSTLAAGDDGAMGEMMHQHTGHAIHDDRISLGLSPQMKQHQLSNMRAHMEAVQSIVGLLAKDEFDQAAQVAHSQLGLTDEMKQMCGSFGNEKFERLGLAFHESGDKLGDVLKTRDMGKSLQALHETTGYCVQCHATFRQ